MLCLPEKGKSNVLLVNSYIVLVLAGNQVILFVSTSQPHSLSEFCFFEVFHTEILIDFFTSIQGEILKAILLLLTMLEQITLNYPRWLSGSERRN